MSRVIDGTPDQTEGSRFSAEASDDAFQQSMARLSLYLATRQSTALLPAPLPARRRWTGWPYLMLLVVAGAGVVGYHYPAFQGDLLRATTSTVAEAMPAVAGPVQAATVPAQAATVPAEPAPPVTVAQQPALAAPSPVSATEEPPLVQAVLALPPPKAAEPTPPPVESITADAELAWPEVLEIQRRLVSLGVNPGPLDGISGPRTMAGVQRYQELKGLAVTGKANRGMLKLLQQDSASSATLEARAQ